MKSRRRWIGALLAVLLNVGGGPVAWAQWLDTSTAAPVEGSMAADCAGHAQPAGDSTPGPDPMPCCESGDCHCAVPLALAIATTTAPLQGPPAASPQPVDTSAIPSRPLDDNLRPPIG